MSYQDLMRLQDAAQVIFAACLLGGLVFLLAGLIRARWVGLSKRIWVVLCSFGIWLLGVVVYGGAIAYTHSRPNGPHAFDTYMDAWVAQQCVEDAARQGCNELRKKCAEGDRTRPACRILNGEDPDKL